MPNCSTGLYLVDHLYLEATYTLSDACSLLSPWKKTDHAQTPVQNSRRRGPFFNPHPKHLQYLLVLCHTENTLASLIILQPLRRIPNPARRIESILYQAPIKHLEEPDLVCPSRTINRCFQSFTRHPHLTVRRCIRPSQCINSCRIRTRRRRKERARHISRCIFINMCICTCIKCEKSIWDRSVRDCQR